MDEKVEFKEEWRPGYRRYTVGRPPDDVGVVTLTVAYDHALAAVAELRAVLAPLLDEPWEWCTGYDRTARGRSAITEGFCCRFCGNTIPDDHAPDCPVLRRDALLGR